MKYSVLSVRSPSFTSQITCCLIYLWMHIWLWIQTAANSSTPLKITSTDQGIRLYTFVSYYNDLLQITWHYKWVPRPRVRLCECLFEISGLIVMCRPQEHGHRLFWPHQERRGGGADIPADHRAHGEGHGGVRHRVLRWEGRREEDRGAVRSRWGWVNPALSQPNKPGHLEITVLFRSIWGRFCRIPETQVSWSVIISLMSHQSQHISTQVFSFLFYFTSSELLQSQREVSVLKSTFKILNDSFRIQCNDDIYLFIYLQVALE